MGWIRVDDQFDDHPKMAAIGPLGWALWLSGLAYCNRNLTDGFIPWSAARKLVTWEFLGPEDERGRKVYRVTIGSGMMGDNVDSDFVIELLLDAGVWDEVDGGYMVHDYADYQPLKADVERQRDQTRERVERWRDKKKAEKRNARGNAVTPTVTNAYRNGVSNAGGNAPVTPAPKPNKDTLTSDGDAVSGNGVSNAVTSEERQAMFAAFMAVFYPRLDSHRNLTKPARGELNAAVRDLLAIGASPPELPGKVALYRQQMPDVECTPSAVVKHWNRLGQQPPGRPMTREEREFEEHMAKTRAKDANVF